MPDNSESQEVFGHRRNPRELEANPRLNRHWVQNLNLNPALPLADASVVAR